MSDLTLESLARRLNIALRVLLGSSGVLGSEMGFSTTSLAIRTA